MTDNERYERDKASVISMIRFILMALIIVAICFLGTKIAIVLIPFLIGFLLAKCAYAIASPIVGGILKNKKSKNEIFKAKRVTATFIYYLLLIVIALLCTYVIYESIGQLTNAVSSIANYASTFDPNQLYNDLMSTLDKANIDTDSFGPTLLTILSDLGTQIASQVPGFISSLISSILNTVGNIPYGIFVVVCVIFSGHYFINDSKNILHIYNKIIPHRGFRIRALSLIDNLASTLFRALSGYILLFIITTVEAYIFLWFAGVKYALILAIVTGLIDFMPVLGISATMIPVMIYCAFHGNYKAIIILIIGMAVMTIVRRVIEPPILGKSLHLHPLLMLVSMAGGVYIWGAIGFLLGPTVLIIILDILKVFEFDKKIMDYVTHFIAGFMPDKKEKFKKASQTNN